MTTINDKITRAKELIAQRETIDAELAALFAGGTVAKKTKKCGTCRQEGHSTRTCPNKEKPTAALETPTTPKSTMQFL
jgi:hypothetical protein